MYINLQDALKKLLLKYAMKREEKNTLEIKLHKSIKEYRSPEKIKLYKICILLETDRRLVLLLPFLLYPVQRIIF